MPGPWEQFKADSAAKQEGAPVEGARPWEQFAEPKREPSMMESFASGAVQGAVPFGGGSFIDEAVGTVSPDAQQYIKDTESANPVTFLAGNLAGGIASPDPFSKIKAVRNAGLLAKMGISALGNAADSFMTSVGSAKGDLTERVSKASENLLDNGLWSIAMAPLRALGLRQSSAEKAVGKIAELGKDEAKAASKLGLELKESLSQPQAQLELNETIRSFQPNSLSAINTDRAALGEDLTKLATETLANKSVNLQTPLEKVHESLASFQPDELTPGALRAKRQLDGVLRPLEEAVAGGDPLTGKTGNLDFASALAQKQKLGKMIWEENTFKDPEIKREAQNLYFGISKALEKADDTGSFKKINQGFDATYKLQDVAESLDQGKIVGLADPQSGNYKYVDDVKKIFKAVPEDVKAGRLVNSDKIFNETLPEYAIKARVMKQITGRLPGEQSLALDMLKGRFGSLGNFMEGNKLQFINRLGSEEAGKSKPALSGSLKTLSGAARGSQPALVNLGDDE